MQSKKKVATKKVAKTKDELMAERRKQRPDLGSMRSVLNTPQVDGWVFRWANDFSDNAGRNKVPFMLNAGWQIWKEPFEVADKGVLERDKDLGSGHRISVGERNGEPLFAVLLAIPREIYDIDQELKEEERREKERGILGQVDQEGFYDPNNKR